MPWSWIEDLKYTEYWRLYCNAANYINLQYFKMIASQKAYVQCLITVYTYKYLLSLQMKSMIKILQKNEKETELQDVAL